jgi:N6-adenosine-specific RNA methylase IME4
MHHQIDILKTSPECLRALALDGHHKGMKQVQLITADPPWESTCLHSGHAESVYKLIPDKDMIHFFASLKKWFTPTKTCPVGLMVIWFCNDKFDLSLKCLNAAGYDLIGINSWHKTRLNDEPLGLNMFRGNVELFMVGRKQLKKGNGKIHTSRGIIAQPFSDSHSSKPLEFYTEYLPFLVKNLILKKTSGRTYENIQMCDLFTRHSQKGFVSMGDEFEGERVTQLSRKRVREEKETRDTDKRLCQPPIFIQTTCVK